MESQFNSRDSAFTWETAATPLGNPEFMTHDAMQRGGDRPPSVEVTRNIAEVATSPQPRPKHQICYFNQ